MNNAQQVLFEVKGHTGIISLNSPPGNELLRPDFISVAQFLDWSSRPEIRGMVIRGAGRHFSSGANLEELFRLASDKDFLMERMDAGKELLNAISTLNIPVMAQISGICFGGGLEIALACHLRICSENALFAFPEINRNLLPGMGGTTRLCALIGQSRGLSLLLSGDTLNASDALQWGLVDDCTTKTDLDDEVMKRMDKLTGDRPRRVVEHVMQAWQNSRVLSFQEALQEETRLFYELAKDELKRRKSEQE